ncbi:MAG: hypothetical protein OXR07_06700 [Nitrospira sp.]|nr:hypothetical protein [Nitrospira sp.]MDD9860097.1 hypothetical protein [Nitrospira sp.]
MAEPYTILKVMGPYREPREPALSFDYSVQRATWATPQGVRVKIGLQGELDMLKAKMQLESEGTPGQQLRINQILGRAIADCKLDIANAEHLFDERRDVMIMPFTESLSHLFPRLESWMNQERNKLRQDIAEKVGL